MAFCLKTLYIFVQTSKETHFGHISSFHVHNLSSYFIWVSPCIKFYNLFNFLSIKWGEFWLKVMPSPGSSTPLLIINILLCFREEAKWSTNSLTGTINSYNRFPNFHHPKLFPSPRNNPVKHATSANPKTALKEKIGPDRILLAYQKLDSSLGQLATIISQSIFSSKLG